MMWRVWSRGRFPVAEMAKRGFIKAKANVKDQAESIVRGLIDRAGGFAVTAPLCRKSDGCRRNAKMDSYALAAWCMYVLGEAERTKPKAKYKKGVITPAFLRIVAKFSAFDDGPKRAQRFLAERGIALIIAPHLSNTLSRWSGHAAQGRDAGDWHDASLRSARQFLVLPVAPMHPFRERCIAAITMRCPAAQGREAFL